jgi:hypothetical protein
LISNIPISTEANRKQTENGIFTATDPYRLLNSDSRCKNDAKSKEGESKAKPLQRSAKHDETMAKKQNNLLSLRG